jgi:hypothetical protein
VPRTCFRFSRGNAVKMKEVKIFNEKDEIDEKEKVREKLELKVRNKKRLMRKGSE